MKALSIRNLSKTYDNGTQALKGIDLTVRAGEILGVAWVAGNGQSELLEVLGGYMKGTGSIRVNGQEIDLTGRYSDGRSRRHRGIAASRLWSCWS